MCRLTTLTFAILTTLMLSTSHAEIKTKKITYQHAGTELEGVLAWDDSKSSPRPGILVVHEWWGLNDYAKSRAKQLAEMGYVAFALDMYGQGKVTNHPAQAGEWAGQIRENTDAWKARALAGLEILKQQPYVDNSKLAAIGYCFGGSTVLQLGYANVGLKGVASFHGALTPPSEEGDDIATKILICHGANDAFISEDSAQTIRQALTKRNADWQMIYYANARHGFTNPNAGDYGLDNLKYDKAADERSWEAMDEFFEELFEDDDD